MKWGRGALVAGPLSRDVHKSAETDSVNIRKVIPPEGNSLLGRTERKHQGRDQHIYAKSCSQTEEDSITSI